MKENLIHNAIQSVCQQDPELESKEELAIQIHDLVSEKLMSLEDEGSISSVRRRVQDLISAYVSAVAGD